MLVIFVLSTEVVVAFVVVEHKVDFIEVGG